MWRWYLMGAGRRGRRTLAKRFYAPDLDTAFALARAEWPMADTWECFGASDVECEGADEGADTMEVC